MLSVVAQPSGGGFRDIDRTDWNISGVHLFVQRLVVAFQEILQFPALVEHHRLREEGRQEVWWGKDGKRSIRLWSGRGSMLDGGHAEGGELSSLAFRRGLSIPRHKVRNQLRRL
jgi:hypothetical protein